MESTDFHHALALLDWQIELGATEAVGDAPVNRYELPAKTEAKKTAARVAEAPTPAPVDGKTAAIDAAKRAAAGAQTIEELRLALEAFEHCTLKRGARNLVLSDGIAGAKVMIIGEAPGREEDMQGRPFIGRAGQMLDRMFAAIDMGRDHKTAPVYITNILPWRPPQNRDPSAEEIAMMRPFVERHIALAKPDVLVLMGNISVQALLGKRGITRLRGQWAEVFGVPALPMFHPAYLLRTSAAKREAWADLLSLQARVQNG